MKKVSLKVRLSSSMQMVFACAVAGLLPAVLACGMLPSRVDETPAPETTLAPATPTDDNAAGVVTTSIPTHAAPVTPPQHGALYYQTPFSESWPIVEGDKASGKPVSGGYQIDIVQPWAFYLYTTHVQRSTFFAEITVTPQQCPAGNGAYGMIFHYQNETAYRFATIWCSGRYSLMERTGALSAITLSEDALPAEIDPSTGEHVVSVRSAYNRLTLYMDGLQIVQVDVAAMPTGDVGPYAETTGNPLSVLMSHLSVYYE